MVPVQEGGLTASSGRPVLGRDVGADVWERAGRDLNRV
jgi:hypothetical protein